MTWTVRQRAMLQEMGVRLWAPAMPRSSADVEASALPPATQGHAGASPMRVEAAPQPPPIMDDHVAAVMTDRPIGNRPPGIATMDWPALRDAVASCTACGLCHNRTNTVFGTGHLRAQWMVVGEAPGERPRDRALADSAFSADSQLQIHPPPGVPSLTHRTMSRR